MCAEQAVVYVAVVVSVVTSEDSFSEDTNSSDDALALAAALHQAVSFANMSTACALYTAAYTSHDSTLPSQHALHM